MPVKLGASTIAKLFLGNTPIVKAYVGSSLVYQLGNSTPEPIPSEYPEYFPDAFRIEPFNTDHLEDDKPYGDWYWDGTMINAKRNNGTVLPMQIPRYVRESDHAWLQLEFSNDPDNLINATLHVISASGTGTGCYIHKNLTDNDQFVAGTELTMTNLRAYFGIGYTRSEDTPLAYTELWAKRLLVSNSSYRQFNGIYVLDPETTYQTTEHDSSTGEEIPVGRPYHVYRNELNRDMVVRFEAVQVSTKPSKYEMREMVIAQGGHRDPSLGATLPWDFKNVTHIGDVSIEDDVMSTQDIMRSRDEDNDICRWLYADSGDAPENYTIAPLLTITDKYNSYHLEGFVDNDLDGDWWYLQEITGSNGASHPVWRHESKQEPGVYQYITWYTVGPDFVVPVLSTELVPTNASILAYYKGQYWNGNTAFDGEWNTDYDTNPFSPGEVIGTTTTSIIYRR